MPTRSFNKETTNPAKAHTTSQYAFELEQYMYFDKILLNSTPIRKLALKVLSRGLRYSRNGRATLICVVEQVKHSFENNVLWFL